MKIGALQTAYLPWLGFFDQIFQCDLFIIYDDLQYTKKDWRNRNKIKTSDNAQWLTVPVVSKNSHKKKINEIDIAPDMPWAEQHWQAIKMNYSKSPFFNQYADFFYNLYKNSWTKLSPLNREIIDTCLDWLKIRTKVLYSSESGIEQDYLSWCGGRPDATERICYLCNRFNAWYFLEGPAGKNYVREDILKDAGICLEYHNYPHPVYHQRFGRFIPYLSVVDLLFNHGNESLAILTNGTTR
ncbi:WbqC family protein [Desulfonema magnum]|uniref:WbqC-like domain-containing protein n=1 Tax=Desulfonema magnum TaxID=45655 RepID=A0A975BFE6_9BACT|nr:WbqC family protein [Desulfonema magnum]QTA84487.1 WbqC-like domain-containing protein [Desulfonema magnum]